MFMKKIRKANKAGFTLLEIMLVVAILVVLTGITYIGVEDAINRSKNQQDTASDKFVNQLQSQTDYIRTSMLRGTPAHGAASST